MIIRFSVVAALLVTASVAPAYQSGVAGRWKNYTDMRTVRALDGGAANIWAATSGGVFQYTPSQNQFSAYTTADGLSTNDVTAVLQDAQGRLWFGTTEGFVTMHDPATSTWREIRGIAESNHVQKAVRAFYPHNDTLFIGTEFGVAVYRLGTDEFADSYVNFGFVSQPRVNDVLVHQNTVWVATDSGVASASLALPNLSTPLAWTRYSTSTRNAISLVVFNGVLYAGTNEGVSYFQNGSFVEQPAFTGLPVVSIVASSSGRLMVVWNDGAGFRVEAITSPTSSAELIASNTSTRATAIASNPEQGNLWIGTPARGLAYWNGSGWTYLAPNGPASNLFSSLAVDESGVLWAGSGLSGRGAGFYRFDISRPEHERWKNFSYEEYPVLGNSPTDAERNDYYKISIGVDGSVWASNWGRGVVEVKNDSILRRITTPVFSTSVPTDSAYVVIGSAVPDESGRTWFINRTAFGAKYLVSLNTDGSFTYYSKSLNSTEGRLTAMVIDRNRTKWIANSEPHDKPTTGLVFFNEDPSIVTGTSATNGWGSLGEPTLLNNVVLSLAVDLDGDISVGTDAGMQIITNPRTPSQNMFTPPATRGQSIQAIAIDAVNNKWVGTREGILELSPDGVQLLNLYTVESTQGKLLSNDIRALAIDQQRGIIYIGTEKGLSSLEIPAVQASRSYTTLEFGPNPFHIPHSGQLQIRNLAANSSIRILSVSGRLVREFPSQGGGRAFWDGRNSEGDFVPTGVYFVVAYTENGNQLTTGKIAVVRR